MEEEEEGKDRGPPPPAYVRLFKIGIVVAIVIAAVASSLPFILQAIAQPNIAITDSGFGAPGCGLLELSQTITYSFSLVNTGEADGFVQIGFYIDNDLAASNTYLVPQGALVPKTADVVVDDCAGHSLRLQILEISKA